jgi:two-component system copper resistance phosphate regulon response regulator CusR
VKILLLEDDPELAPALVDALQDHEFVVDHVTTIADADLLVATSRHDVLVLDRAVPDGDALDLVVRLRRRGVTTPVLLLTARGQVADRVAGFEQGADDYVVKPFALPELVVRLRSLARRASDGERARVLRGGPLELDVVRHRLTLDGVLLSPTPKEFAVLEVLLEHAGEVVTRSELVERCWDELTEPSSNVVDVLVAQLRRRLGEPGLIETVRGVGYRLRDAS